MSGLWRNFLTLCWAVWRRDRQILTKGCDCWFWVSPLDVGIRTLKSDRYFQMAEAAQLDFGIRSGLLSAMRKSSCVMVNAEQHIQFLQPIQMLNRVRVLTRISASDDKFIHFEHVFYRGEQLCATVRVKAKFKRGRLTIAPTELMQ
jgi:acyl-CoA thioesterase FadM